MNFVTYYSPRKKQTYTKYKDIFTWTYEDLKKNGTHNISYVISIKEGVKYFQQKLCKFYQKLKSIIKKEIEKLMDARIIFKLRNLTWASNLVPVKQKGEITHCVDLKTSIEHQKRIAMNQIPWNRSYIRCQESGSKIFSLLDGFSS